MKQKQTILRLVLRFAGATVGLFSIILGVLSIAFNMKSISTLNSITFILMGAMFMYYGITGKSTLRKQ